MLLQIALHSEAIFDYAKMSTNPIITKICKCQLFAGSLQHSSNKMTGETPEVRSDKGNLVEIISASVSIS